MNNIKVITNDDIQQQAYKRAIWIRDNVSPTVGVVRLFGIPRGGVPAVYAVAKALEELNVQTLVVDEATAYTAHVFVDDISDTGRTRERYLAKYGQKLFVTLYHAQHGQWLVFPWENQSDHGADDVPVRLLQYIGEDAGREGLRETPTRMLKAWREYTSGYQVDAEALLKTFTDGAENVDEMVLVRDIPVYSHCEHHLAPFFGVAHVAYIPNGKVVGLSKLPRLVDAFSRRLQVQERLTQQVAHAINDVLHPRGVGVVVECRHMCMEARGIRARGTTTKTSCLLGAMKTDASARAEFLGLSR